MLTMVSATEGASIPLAPSPCSLAVIEFAFKARTLRCAVSKQNLTDDRPASLNDKSSTIGFVGTIVVERLPRGERMFAEDCEEEVLC